MTGPGPQDEAKPRPSAVRRSAAPVLIVLPSVVSGIGVAFILAGIFIDHELIRGIFLSIGVMLLWLDFFITMAIFRFSLRSIDRRLRRMEDDRLQR
jgi:hypothetical protein